MEWSKILDWLSEKISVSVIMFLALIVSSVIIFSPITWIQILKLEKFVNDNGHYFGFIFLVSAGYFVFITSKKVNAKIKTSRNQKRKKDELIETLKTLDDRESSILREFVMFKKQSTISFPISEPTIAGLIDKEILETIGKLAEDTHIGLLIPCKINPLIVQQIKEHSFLNPKNLTEEELREERPLFNKALYWRSEIKVVQLENINQTQKEES